MILAMLPMIYWFQMQYKHCLYLILEFSFTFFKKFYGLFTV